jgi:hypothetical protein
VRLQKREAGTHRQAQQSTATDAGAVGDRIAEFNSAAGGECLCESGAAGGLEAKSGDGLVWFGTGLKVGLPK